MARIDDFIGKLGSLDTGTAPDAMRPDRLPYKRNVEHSRAGAVAKRLGRKPIVSVAAFAENLIAPPLTNLGATSGSTLTSGTLRAWLTYSTVNGETDDVHSSLNSIIVTSGDGVTAWAPFHIMSRKVERYALASRTLELSDYFKTNVLANFAADTFNGWYVYCRNPQAQDETKLGLNPENFKTWDRRNFIAKVEDYADGVFTLDRVTDVDLKGMNVDIMMPDRTGNPVRAVNLYVSMSTTGDRYLVDSLSPTEPTSFTITSIPTSNRKSPYTRITRTAPTVTVAATTDTNPATGVIATAVTDIEAGEYLGRYAWETDSSTLLDNGNWPEDSSFGLMPRPRRATQIAWPSAATRFIVGTDGLAITITPPTRPSGVETAHFSLRKTAAAETKTLPSSSPSSTHRAYKYAGSNTTALTASPSTFRASYGTEFTTQNYLDAQSTDGTFLSGDVTAAVNKFQIEWQHSGTDTSSNSATCLVVRLKGVMGNAYSGATAPKISVLYWNNFTGAWVTLRSDISPTDTSPRTLRFCVDYDSTHNESGRHVFAIQGSAGACFAVDSVKEDAYRTSMASDPTVTTDDVIVDISTASSVVIKSRPAPAIESDSLPRNTTGQAPVTLHAAYVGTNFGRPQDNVTTIVACADSVFVQDGATLDRVYQHESRNGLTSKNTLEVCQAPWQISSVPGGRVYFCNERNTLGFNLRFDGVQTWRDGLEPGNGTAILPPGTEQPPPDPDPTPDLDCGRFEFKELWRPDPTSGEPHFLHGGGGQKKRVVDVFRCPRWTVGVPAGNHAQIYDWRDMRWTATANMNAAKLKGLYGRLFQGRMTGGLFGISEVKTEYSEDIVKCITAGLTQQPDPRRGDAPDSGDAATSDVPANEGVDPGQKDYYYVLEREVPTEGRSYVALSPPRKIATVTVVPKPATSTTNKEHETTTTPAAGTMVLLHLPSPQEPSVTHVRVGRNLTDSGLVYKLVERVALHDLVLDANGNLTIEDQKSDEELGIMFDFEVGTPPPASRMLYHQGRRWFVPYDDTGAVAYSDALDPESVSPFAYEVPNFSRPCSINALAPYGNRVIAHGDNGLAMSVGGSTSYAGTDPLRFEALAADEGAMGPGAWLNSDSAHFYVTRNSISVLVGSEPRVLSDMIKGTVGSITKTDAAAAQMSCVRYRSAGEHLAWFSYSTRPDGRCDRVLVFDLNVGPGFEENRRLWSDWTEMYAASLCRTERIDGTEIVLIGDHWGTVYEYGAVKHDAGLHIDAEFRTKPISKVTSGAGRARTTFTPRWLVARIAGVTGAFLNFDVLKDGTGSRANSRLQRLILQSPTGDARWGRFRWGQADWGETRSTGFADYPVSLGTLFSQAQFVFSQKWADMPPGASRSQTFEMTGFTLESDMSSARKIG